MKEIELEPIVNKKFKYFLIVVLIVFLSLNFIKLPYYIVSKGGTLSASDKILISGEGTNNIKGSFHLAYVELKDSNIFSFIKAKLTNQKIMNVPKINETESKEETQIRSLIDLKVSEITAIEQAFLLAGKTYEKDAVTNFVYLVDQGVKNIFVGDILYKIDGIEMKYFDKIKASIQSKNVGDKVKVELIRNKELKEIELAVRENKGKKYIGILSTEIYKLVTNPVVKFNFTSGESGPSGGLAIALTIYNNLTKEDITKGKKIVVTGAISRDGEINNIGGVEQKLDGAISDKADIFIVPSGENYDTVKKICEKKKCPKLIKAINFRQVVEELKK